MRKILLIVLLLVGNSIAYSQTQACTSKTTPNGKIVFYGIDFSLARFSHITENPEGLIQVLPHINRLFIYEAKKYNAAKFFKKEIVETDLSYSDTLIQQIDPKTLILNEDYDIPQEKIIEHIKNYPDNNKGSVGLTIIAEQMDKKDKSASYCIVFFDQKTKETLSICRKKGNAGGFGIRNFWASSALNLMKDWK